MTSPHTQLSPPPSPFPSEKGGFNFPKQRSWWFYTQAANKENIALKVYIFSPPYPAYQPVGNHRKPGGGRDQGQCSPHPIHPITGVTAHPWGQALSQNGAKVNVWCHNALLCLPFTLWEFPLSGRGTKPPCALSRGSSSTHSACTAVISEVLGHGSGVDTASHHAQEFLTLQKLGGCFCPHLMEMKVSGIPLGAGMPRGYPWERGASVIIFGV